jgi:hypothetical protein
LNRTGPVLAQSAQPKGKGVPAPAHWQLCTGAHAFLSNSERVLSLFNRATDNLQKRPPVSVSSQWEVPDGVHARPKSGELLDRPIGARIGATARSTPNSRPINGFPPINFIFGDLLSSVHENRGDYGHLIMFPTIGGLQVRIGDTVSIPERQESLNEGE